MTTKTKFQGYVGTYTKKTSKGIYSFILDTKKAEITDIHVAASLGNPTYLSISHDGARLYSVVKDGQNGGVAAFAINDDSGELTLLNTIIDAGSPPCHVSIDHNDKYLFSANYHKGTVESYAINQEDGSIEELVSFFKHQGSGPDPRQEKPHTHYAGVTPEGNYVVVVDLGTDELITYKVSEEGILVEANRLSLQPGSGPRHLVFHPIHDDIAYIMTEFSSEVIRLSYNSEDGSFVDQQSITTLPDDFTENNQGSAIHVSSDGRSVYAGNRGHNSLAIFSADQATGELSFVERVSTEGDWPRDFVLDPTEQFLIASNQNSDTLTLFARNSDTGKLTLVQKDIAVPEPVCLKFR